MTSDLLLPGESDQQRALQAPVERAASQNPVISYLASLGSGNSRRVQKTALDRIADALSGGKIQDCRFFPWEQLDYGMVTAIKAWLDDKICPRDGQPVPVRRPEGAKRSLAASSDLGGSLPACHGRPVRLSPPPAHRTGIGQRRNPGHARSLPAG